MAKTKKQRRNAKSLANLKRGKKFRSDDEATKEAGKKGGIASGKARSFKALARELLTDEEKKELIRAQMEMAKHGSVNSFKVLMDIGDVTDDISEEDDALSRSLEELAKGMENDQ